MSNLIKIQVISDLIEFDEALLNAHKCKIQKLINIGNNNFNAEYADDYKMALENLQNLS